MYFAHGLEPTDEMDVWRVPLQDHQAVDADAQPMVLPTARALAPRASGTSLFYHRSSLVLTM
jgi:hypothetical protein